MMRNVLFAAALLASCGGPRSTEPSPAEASSTARTETTTETPTVGAAPSGSDSVATTAPIAAGPRPVLAIRGTPDRSGHVSIAIENRGTELARIAPRILIERDRDGTFATLEAAALEARDDCEHPAAECIELAPGGALHPPEWLGTIGDAQCACERCTAAGPGSYRFVVTTCDGAHRLEGEAFELAP